MTSNEIKCSKILRALEELVQGLRDVTPSEGPTLELRIRLDNAKTYIAKLRLQIEEGFDK